MRSDEEIERLLEDWLVETAEPVPQHLLEEVLDGVSRRSQQSARKSTRFGKLARGVTSVALAAGVLLGLIVIAPRVVPQLQAVWRGVTGAGSAELLHWDATLQFRGYPSQMNPAPDAYGHPVVFTYLRSSGPAHDPAQYVALDQFESDGIQSWYDPAFEGLSVGWAPGDDMLTMHPFGGGVDSHSAIVAWRSPVDTSLRISGRVEVDATCGDGINFSIEQGSRVVESFPLPMGSQAFELDVDSFLRGEVLYFIVEPGADSECDTTRFNVTIETT